MNHRSEDRLNFTNSEKERGGRRSWILKEEGDPITELPVRSCWLYFFFLKPDNRQEGDVSDETFSQRRGWRRTVGGCGWSRLWPHRRSRSLVTSLWRCWSATGICCAVKKTLMQQITVQTKEWRWQLVMWALWWLTGNTCVDSLQLRRLFLCSRPGGGRDGPRLEGLAGRGGGWAGSLGWTMSRLGWWGRSRAVSPWGDTGTCGVDLLYHTAKAGALLQYYKNKWNETLTSSRLRGLWMKETQSHQWVMHTDKDSAHMVLRDPKYCCNCEKWQ